MLFAPAIIGPKPTRVPNSRLGNTFCHMEIAISGNKEVAKVNAGYARIKAGQTFDPLKVLSRRLAETVSFLVRCPEQTMNGPASNRFSNGCVWGVYSWRGAGFDSLIEEIDTPPQLALWRSTKSEHLPGSFATQYVIAQLPQSGSDVGTSDV